ncbi:hypothetical protein HK102_010588, partial [Quaeritorhiza haematococci]
TAIASACVLFHRFFMRESLKHHKYYDIAATALFIATKVEDDSTRKLHYIITTCARKAAKNDNLQIEEGSKEYTRWRDNIAHYEEFLLATLCFDLCVEHPYPHVLDILEAHQISGQTGQAAWGFVNDSYRLTLCLQYSPREIALACVYMAAKLHGEDIHKHSKGKPIWELMEIEVTALQDMLKQILTLYPLELLESPQYLANHKPRGVSKVPTGGVNGSLNGNMNNGRSGGGGGSGGNGGSGGGHDMNGSSSSTP